MKKILKSKTNILAGIILAVYIISLIPILYVSFFNHPTADDYGFSSLVHNTYINGGNILEIIGSSIQQIINSYFSWQGTFSAIFIFSLQPGVFSQDLYFATTFIMIIALTCSTVFFFDTVIVKWLKSKKSYMIIISILLLALSIQFIPDKNQAFYWFNGSAYYTLFYSFALVLFSVIIRIILSVKKRTKVILCIIGSFLAIVIGGGNYTTALATAVLTAVALIALIYKKSPAKIYCGIILLFLLIAFAVNVLAPGNQIRQETVTSMSPVKAVISSLFYAFVYIGEWSGLPQIISFLFITPILYILSGKCKWNFKYPILVICLAFGCYASQFTPSLYAMSSVGSGRQIDIYYYSYYILLAFMIFYICGWINKRYSEITNIKKLTKFSSKHLVSLTLAFVLLFVSGSFNHGIKELTSVDTFIAAITGTVNQYDYEYNEVLNVLESDDEVCEIDDIETVPDFFSSLEISESSDYWINQHLARYFDKEEVVLKSSKQ